MTNKLIDTLERDIRNQVVINQMKKLDRKGELLVHIERLKRLNWLLIAGLLFCVLTWIVAIRKAAATECPVPGQSCKVLVLTPDEEKVLVEPRGILDTASQARNLDLGNVVAYFRQKIAAAPAGDVKPAEKPAVKNERPTDKPVDKKR